MRTIDHNDDYYLIDFFRWISQTKFYNEGKRYLSRVDQQLIASNLSRCCAVYYTAGGASYIMKVNDEKLFIIVKDAGYRNYGVYLRYINKKGKEDLLFLEDVIGQFESMLPNYNKIICKPYHADRLPTLSNKVFNVFKGFQATYIEKPEYALIEPLLHHIKVVWCNHDDSLYHYILSWLAWPLQKLTKSDVSLFLRGEQGAGKSLILEFLYKWVYGLYTAISLDDIDDLLTRFNSHLEGKLLIFINETAAFNKNKFVYNYTKLKNKITGATLNIEKKGSDVYSVENVMNVAITSNHDGINVEKKDRRYLCIEANDCYIDNHDYFDHLVDQCFNQHVGDLFYTFLRDYKMVKLSPVPLTSYKNELIQQGKAAHELFLDDLFQGFITILIPCLFHWDAKEHQFYFSRKELYDEFISQTEEKSDSGIFSKSLSKYKCIKEAPRFRINGSQQQCSYIVNVQVNDKMLYDILMMVSINGNVSLQSLIPN